MANKNEIGQCHVSNWSDIVDVSGSLLHTVGLKSDGTVVAVGDNSFGQCNVSSWTDIIAISAGISHTIGLKEDGTIVATGNNTYGECNVSDWKDISLGNADIHNDNPEINQETENTDIDSKKDNNSEETNSTNNNSNHGSNNSSNNSSNADENYTANENTNLDPCANGHNWETITETVHHDEVGHYETVQEAKKVIKYQCAVCYSRFDSQNEYYSHFDEEHGHDANLVIAFRERYEQVDDWEYYDTQKWVIDQEAYDETVITGYKCNVCGTTK